MTFVILKGPCYCGASFIVLYDRLRFFASSQTICPGFHCMSVGVFFCATLLRASIAKVLLFCKFSACCSAIRLFDFVSYPSVSGGSQPTSSWLGGKPVVAFAELLCTKVATASQLLQSV
jgi:hypothetical protein